MPSILDPLVDKAAGVRKSSAWYRNAVSSIADRVSARRLMSQGRLNGRPSIGRLNMFFYDPKYKKTLPCLLYTSPSPRDAHESRMPSSA